MVNKLNINMIALAVCLAFSAGAMAQGLLKNVLRTSGKNNIAVEYQLCQGAGCRPPVVRQRARQRA